MYVLFKKINCMCQIRYLLVGGGGGGGCTLKTIDKQDVETTFIECACLK